MQDKKLICLVCGWKGTEQDRINTFKDQTITENDIKIEDGHFYILGHPYYGDYLGWNCTPVVEDKGHEVTRLLCESIYYKQRQYYYANHDKVWVTDDIIEKYYKSNHPDREKRHGVMNTKHIINPYMKRISKCKHCGEDIYFNRHINHYEHVSTGKQGCYRGGGYPINVAIPEGV